MPSTIPAAEPKSAAPTVPCDRLTADDPIPKAASSAEPARQAAAKRPSHCAAGRLA